MRLLTTLSLISALLFSCKSNESVLLKLKYAKNEQQDYNFKVTFFCSDALHFNTAIGITYSGDSIVHNSEFYITAKINAIKKDVKIGDGNPPFGYSEYYDSKKNYADMDYNEAALDAKYSPIIANYYQLGYNSSGDVIKDFTLYGKQVIPPFAAGIIQIPYPHTKIKVGDTWAQKTLSPFAGTDKGFAGNCVYTYTIDDIKTDKIIIDVVLEIEAGGLTANAIKNFKGTGTYAINRANGHVIDAYIKIPQQGCNDALISIDTTKAPAE